MRTHAQNYERWQTLKNTRQVLWIFTIIFLGTEALGHAQLPGKIGVVGLIAAIIVGAMERYFRKETKGEKHYG